ncbi:MAG: SDR family oxidoreductase [bacterium]|nr:SDR family oxidoreductase [bacterium]
MTSFQLEGKRALVTGGSKGIGFGIARGLAEAGADLVLVGRNQGDLDQARERLTAQEVTVATYAYDLQDVDGIGAFFQRIAGEQGAIDILINNAGGTRRGMAQDVSSEDWSFVLNLNLTAVFHMCQAFGRDCIAHDRPGKIVNIASLLSEGARPGTASYAASKGGIRQMTKALAVDWAPHRINVNGIGPGYIRTPLTQTLWEDGDFDAWVKKRTPLGRWGEPEDLAGAAVFLASSASDFVTGQILYVDGGWLAGF